MVSEFCAGKERAFRCVYDSYASSLRYFAAKYIDDTLIDDVVQDAFVSLWEHRSDFASEIAIKAYLYKVVRNTCLNLLRHKSVQAKYAGNKQWEDSQESFLDNVLETEIFDALLSVFEELPAACKEVYRLSLEGLSHDEIAKKLHITVNTVKKHKNNANHYMRERLKNIFSLLLYF